MIKSYLNFINEYNFSHSEQEPIITQFKIGNHNIDAIISPLEDNSIKFDFMADGSYDKNLKLEGSDAIRLFSKLRRILFDYVNQYNPEVITFFPHDRDEVARKKKEDINSKITIPGYSKRKIGTSTVLYKD
jgi:hypothetical protein